MLPFQDSSPSRDQRRLAEGIPEELLASLSHVTGLRVTGRAERALAWCDRAVKAAPGDPGVNENAGCLYAKLGRADDALPCLERTFGRGYGKRDWVKRVTQLLANSP